MAMHMKNEEKTQKKKSQDKRGFYVALAICAAAIGIAAWSTYDTMAGYLEPTDTESVSGAESTVSAPVTSEPEDDPESTVSEGHAQGSASEIEVETETIAEETVAETETETAAAPEAESSVSEAEAAGAETAAVPASYTVSERYLRPVGTGEILTAFSDIPVYSETMRDYRAHLGADYQAAHGETVKAAANGIVKETYTDMLLGNTIVIEHGDVEISYCGLGETFLVDPGEVVSAGQDIGSVTAAPFESAMESHLHLEAIKNGEVIDPETLFS